jgi:hypothetical protein
MRIFILDKIMEQALWHLQRIHPELQGTIEYSADGIPTRYVDTFPSASPRTPEEEEERYKKRPRAQKPGLPDPPQKPIEDSIPITLDTIENASSETYFREFTNLLNVGFVRGAPLLRVRLVRHGGGTDVLIAGHQALFDEQSFQELCIELLDYYDACSEGRMKKSNDEMSPMLSSVDELYPQEFQRLLKGKRDIWKRARKRLDSIASEHPWRAIPRSMSVSPLLNSTAVIFGSLSRLETLKLLKKCQAHSCFLDSAISASFLTSVAKITSDVKFKHPKADFTLVESIFGRFRSWLGPVDDEQEKALQEANVVPIIASFITSLRSTFDPPIAPMILGPLSSYSLSPLLVGTDLSLWKQAKQVQEFRVEANLSKSDFTDMLCFPVVADLCSDEHQWTHHALPTIVMSQLSKSPMVSQMRARFQIYDEKSSMSCWNPGICVSASVDCKENLQLSISYRKPLIADQVAHDILKRSLERLTL